MSIMFKKILFACILTLAVLTTGAWQGDQVVLAENQETNIPETPLDPDLTWTNLGSSSRNITIDVEGNSISLPGESHKVVEQFAAGLPQEVLTYYSNEQLAKSGWASYDAFEESDGVHYIFYHESHVYLSIEFLKCPDASSSTCVTVWKSEQTNPASVAPTDASESDQTTAADSFGKISPAKGATNVDPTSIVLSWGAISPSPDKYSYCVREDEPCSDGDPNWTGTYLNRSVTLTDLTYGKTYYWQVKAITCWDCVPVTVVYADSGTWWTFKTKSHGTSVVISGNAGTNGATLSYTDGVLKTVTSDSASNYSITVPYNWSGTVTPSKPGYTFSPVSASFVNLIAPVTIQNFTAILPRVIGGNAGVSGAVLSYTDGGVKTVTADGVGNYSILVPYNWSGTVTPSKSGYSFSPASASFVNLIAAFTTQNFTAMSPKTISGSTAVAGVTLSYTDGTAKTATSLADGNYTFQISGFWSGTVTPSHPCFTFSPSSRTYSNVITNQTAQNYTATFAPASGCANVTVNIGGALQGTYGVTAHGNIRDTITGMNSGPVKVLSTNSVPVVDSIRVLFGGVSYSEMMGFPANQLTNNYWFPYYNNVAMNSQLRVSNVGGSSTTITVTYGNGTSLDSYTLAAGATIRKNYAGINSGPLHVTSSTTNILTTIRVLYGGWSYSELMGFPNNQLVKDYWYPYYNNVAMNSQLRVSNVGGSSTTITVTYGNGTPLDSYTLAAGAATRKNYPGINSGPLHVTSSASNILTTIRVLFNNQSFSELSGVPANQLNKEYTYPVYDNATVDSQLRVSNVGGVSTLITVYKENNTLIDSYTLAAGAATRKNYSVNNGPLRVVSSLSNILTTQRLLYLTPGFSSYYELAGLPTNQLTTEYYFPWYNNIAMNSQFRIAVP